MSDFKHRTACDYGLELNGITVYRASGPDAAQDVRDHWLEATDGWLGYWPTFFAVRYRFYQTLPRAPAAWPGASGKLSHREARPSE